MTTRPRIVSIHLMLLFIFELVIKDIDVHYVSIHLMLLFIAVLMSISSIHGKFQYISCYSLSLCSNEESAPYLVSIHLMLLFIPNRSPFLMRAGLFQYISCYSLSLYFTAFLTPNIFIIPQNTMHCKIFTRRLDNSLFWD